MAVQGFAPYVIRSGFDQELFNSASRFGTRSIRQDDFHQVQTRRNTVQFKGMGITVLWQRFQLLANEYTALGIMQIDSQSSTRSPFNLYLDISTGRIRKKQDVRYRQLNRPRNIISGQSLLKSLLQFQLTRSQRRGHGLSCRGIQHDIRPTERPSPGREHRTIQRLGVYILLGQEGTDQGEKQKVMEQGMHGHGA